MVREPRSPRPDSVDIIARRPQSTNANSLLNSSTWASCSHGDSFVSFGAADVTKSRAVPTSSSDGGRPYVSRYSSRIRRDGSGSAVSRRQRLRLLDHERRVHQEQCLLRHRRREPLRGVRVGQGEVEGAERARQVLPIDEAVNRPASRERRLEQIHRLVRRWSGRAGPSRQARRRGVPRTSDACGSFVQAAGSPGRFAGRLPTIAGRLAKSRSACAASSPTSLTRQIAPRASRATPGASAGRSACRSRSACGPGPGRISGPRRG